MGEPRQGCVGWCRNFTCRWYERGKIDRQGDYWCPLSRCEYEGLLTGLVRIPDGKEEFGGVVLRGRLQLELFEQRKRWDFDEKKYLHWIAKAQNVVRLYDPEKDALTLGYMDDVGRCGNEW